MDDVLSPDSSRADHLEPSRWRPTLRRRVWVAAAVIALWAVAIQARLVYLQVVRHKELAAKADRQQMRTIEGPAKRATIVDADTVYAVPTEIGDPSEAAAALCKALGDCDAKDRQALAERMQNGKA